MMRVLILFALCSIASAVQIPLTEPQPSNKQWSHVSHTAKKSHFTVAIVGAGAGGSSAAFWINKARERYGLHIDSIDVYERSDYIGGRMSKWSKGAVRNANFQLQEVRQFTHTTTQHWSPLNLELQFLSKRTRIYGAQRMLSISLAEISTMKMVLQAYGTVNPC